MNKALVWLLFTFCMLGLIANSILIINTSIDMIDYVVYLISDILEISAIPLLIYNEDLL